MRRCELVLFLTGAMTAARGLRAQQKAMSVVGFLSRRRACVDGPVGARGLGKRNSDAVRLRSCVRPVVAAHGRWPRWVPRSTPKRMRDLAGRHPTRVMWILGPTDQHLFPRALLPRQTNGQAAGAGR